MNPWKHNEELRSWLESYMDRHDLTNEEIGKRFSRTPSRISKYLNLDKPGRDPEPDAKDIEGQVRSLKHSIEQHTRGRAQLFPTSATDDAFRVFKQIRSTGDVGLIYGAAGVGKSSAAALFSMEDPSVLYIVAARKKRGADAVAAMLYREMLHVDPSLRWNGRVSRYSWIEEKLGGSGRLLIVDNAHKLDFSGLEVLFDLHDETGVAVALVGNPEVLDKVKLSDQLTSRIGTRSEIKLRKDAAKVAHKVCEQELPGCSEALQLEAETLVGKLGCLRRLRKRLILTREMRQDDQWKNRPDVDAFRAAASLQIAAD